MVDTREEYHDLFVIFVPIAVGLFIVISATIIGLVLRYRRRSAALPEHQKHENTRVEGVYVLMLVFIAAFLIWKTFSTEPAVDAIAKTPGLRVNVVAAQWEWRFSYPQYGITLQGGSNDHEAAGSVNAKPRLVVPTQTSVLFDTVSPDVIHSFWVPERRFKRDVFPGPDHGRFSLMWPHPLIDKGECAEFCGLDHSVMEFSVQAMPPAEFRAWAERHRGQTITEQ